MQELITMLIHPFRIQTFALFQTLNVGSASGVTEEEGALRHI
jgi:hypothetical protein